MIPSHHVNIDNIFSRRLIFDVNAKQTEHIKDECQYI